MNWLYPSLHNGLEAENARLRMAQWATEEPKRVREVAYHSAQILALVRQHPCNTPLEPSVIFHAGVVLACMARLLSVCTSGSSSNSRPETSALRLDHLGSADDAMSSAVLAWVHNGDANTVSLHGVPSLCCDLGRQQVLDQTAEMLKRAHVWGIAQTFARAVLSLRDEGQEKGNSANAGGSLRVVVSTFSPSTHPRGS